MVRIRLGVQHRRPRSGGVDARRVLEKGPIQTRGAPGPECPGEPRLDLARDRSPREENESRPLLRHAPDYVSVIVSRAVDRYGFFPPDEAGSLPAGAANHCSFATTLGFSGSPS